MSRDQVHKMEQIQSAEDKNENSFVYDILTEGHLQGSAHRCRAFSMHAASRCSPQDISWKNKKYRQRRMSLPPNESRISKECPKVTQDIGLMTSYQFKEGAGIDVNRCRRAKSFKERSHNNGDINLRRVRSFKTTTKGLLNQGDGEKIRKEANFDVPYRQSKQDESIVKKFDSCIDSEQSYYRVLVIGARGVGKTSLIDQFMTSDFLENFNVSQIQGERAVTLQVDGIESTLEFVQSEDFQEQAASFQIDGFVVMYCITERTTFDIAIDLLKQMRDEVGFDKAIILVGNKSDLVRKRTISQEEGRSAADAYRCKYIELSAALNLRVDELLVGIHKQIQLKSKVDNGNIETKYSKGKGRKGSFKRTKRFLEKMFLGHSSKDKKTENLYVE